MLYAATDTMQKTEIQLVHRITGQVIEVGERFTNLWQAAKFAFEHDLHVSARYAPSDDRSSLDNWDRDFTDCYSVTE